MSERPSATIIAFPRMKGAPVQQPTSFDPRARPLQTLAALERALAEQRAAILAWRQSLGALRGSLLRLGQSLDLCRDRLAGMADRMDRLGRNAPRPEAWADGVLAHDRATGDA